MLKRNRTQALEKLMPALSILHRAMATTRDSFLAQFKLSRPQMELLISLKHTPQTTSALAKEFNVSASAISQMIDQLIEKELVERVLDPNDRRVANIQLSQNGKELFEKIHEKFLEHVEKKFKPISTKDIENLVAIITKVTDTVSKD